MAAYAAAVSLLKTLCQLLEAPNYSYQHITLLGDGVDSLRCFLEENREVKRDFEIEIRDAVYEAQDIVDSHISSTHLLSPSEVEIRNQSLYKDLERVNQKINSLADMTRSEKFNHLTLNRKISSSVWKKSDEIKRLETYPIVGRAEDFYQLKDRLITGSLLQVVPIVGIAGMGKTALVECLYYDPSIRENFDICGWVKVPTEYNKRDLLFDILIAMNNFGDEIRQKTDDQLAKYLYDFLKRKRYLLILDDIRDVAVWNDLKELFPNFVNGSRIMLTTRNADIAHTAGTPHVLDRLIDEDTLALLLYIVFNEEPSQELFVLAKDIAESCRGLPHAVIIVGKLLRCAEPNAEYWEIVLSSISTCGNYIDLMEALVSLTYKHLPQKLKPCLLYMGMFPYDCDIPLFKIIDLWIVEEFIEPHAGSKAEKGFHIGECFLELYERDFISYQVKVGGEKKGCRIREEVFRDFVLRIAKEEKFLLVIDKDTNFGSTQEDSTSTNDQQRRLCIHTNIVPFVAQNSYSNKSISIARSFHYYGPQHQYPLLAWLDFKLLKVLDAPKIRFYCFPLEILKLIQLRYLALSYNGQLPSAVCKLQNLQVLIVLRYISVKCFGAPSYLPVEIWNMKKLRHLRVIGSNLPDIPLESDLNLESLYKLSNVGAHSCTKQILERIPNLAKLGIQIESLSEDESLSFFSHLDVLNNLQVLKCVVMYPDTGIQVFPRFIPAFPSTLRELNLSGCRFPWEYMSVIATLPALERLILRSYAFQGLEWKVNIGEFTSLEFLQLEDMDLKNWILDDESCFPMLKDLIIRHCYKLREIPDIPTLEMLRVVNCSTSAMDSALAIKEEQVTRGTGSVRFELYSSRDD